MRQAILSLCDIQEGDWASFKRTEDPKAVIEGEVLSIGKSYNEAVFRFNFASGLGVTINLSEGVHRSNEWKPNGAWREVPDEITPEDEIAGLKAQIENCVNRLQQKDVAIGKLHTIVDDKNRKIGRLEDELGASDAANTNLKARLEDKQHTVETLQDWVRIKTATIEELSIDKREHEARGELLSNLRDLLVAGGWSG
jgi:hypothetical protein